MESPDIFDLARIIAAIKRERKIIFLTSSAFILIAFILILLLPIKYTAKSKLLLDRSQGIIVAETYKTPLADFSQAAIDSEVEIFLSRSVAERLIEILEYDVDTESKKNDLINELMSKVAVKREAETYVISISYSDEDPKKAAMIANAYAEAYIQDKIKANRDVSTLTNKWIEQELKDLRAKSQLAYEAALSFRKENNLASVEGRTISDQQLQDVNRMLSEARLQRTTAKAQYDESMRIISQNAVDEALSQSFSNQLADSLRSKYLEASKQYNKLQKELGDSHAAVIKLKMEIKEYADFIIEEMERVAQAQLRDYNVALAKEQEIEKQLQNSIFSKISGDSKMLTLHNLEKEAETYQKLYEDYLLQYQNLSQQKTLPATAARIISYAPIPENSSHPKSALIMGMALIFGVGLGCLLAIIIDDQNKTLRRGGQLINALNCHFLGYISKSLPTHFTQMMQYTIKNNFYNKLPEDIRLSIDKLATDILRFIIKNNNNIFAITSSRKFTGKTFCAIALAHYLEQNKKNTLLITSDPNLEFGKQGLSEITPFLSILSITELDISTSSKLSQSLQEFSAEFDIVLCDLYDFANMGAQKILLSEIRGIILIEEWGVSTANELKFHIENNFINIDDIVGVCLNKADLERLQKEFGYSS